MTLLTVAVGFADVTFENHFSESPTGEQVPTERDMLQVAGAALSLA